MLSYTVQDNIRESGNSRVSFCSFLVPKVGHDGLGQGPAVMSDMTGSAQGRLSCWTMTGSAQGRLSCPGRDGFGPGPVVMSGT